MGIPPLELFLVARNASVADFSHVIGGSKTVIQPIEDRGLVHSHTDSVTSGDSRRSLVRLRSAASGICAPADSKTSQADRAPWARNQSHLSVDDADLGRGTPADSHTCLWIRWCVRCYVSQAHSETGEQKTGFNASDKGSKAPIRPLIMNH